MRGNLEPQDIFEYRHHGKNDASTKIKLQKIGVNSIDELINQTIPKSIHLKEPITFSQNSSRCAKTESTNQSPNYVGCRSAGSTNLRSWNSLLTAFVRSGNGFH